MARPEKKPEPPSQSPVEGEGEKIEGFYDSAELFKERTEITIQHNGHAYRLRQTKNGKLILNK